MILISIIIIIIIIITVIIIKNKTVKCDSKSYFDSYTKSCIQCPSTSTIDGKGSYAGNGFCRCPSNNKWVNGICLVCPTGTSLTNTGGPDSGPLPYQCRCPTGQYYENGCNIGCPTGTNSGNTGGYAWGAIAGSMKGDQTLNGNLPNCRCPANQYWNLSTRSCGPWDDTNSICTIL